MIEQLKNEVGYLQQQIEMLSKQMNEVYDSPLRVE